MHSRIQVIQGDITKLSLDAIVTAANEALVGGHGVDGAVHRAAGPKLFAECQTIKYCAEGDAKVTGGYDLPAKYVIHTVGPVWEGGSFGESEILRSCYANSLRLVEENEIRTVAFPCIATGAHEFPRELACKIALSTVDEWLDTHVLPERVVFCCFEEEDLRIYEHALGVHSAH